MYLSHLLWISDPGKAWLGPLLKVSQEIAIKMLAKARVSPEGPGEE